jgi:hypothetical protein
MHSEGEQWNRFRKGGGGPIRDRGRDKREKEGREIEKGGRERERDRERREKEEREKRCCGYVREKRGIC